MAAEPCGRVNPQLLRTETGLSKQRINHSLKQLQAAGWITKRTRALYDLVDEAGEHVETVAEIDQGATDMDLRAAAELLSDWEPDSQASPEFARQETARAVEWLRYQDHRSKKSDFIEALEFDESVDHWWGRAVQPGLRELAEHGFVEYRSAYNDYKVVELEN